MFALHHQILGVRELEAQSRPDYYCPTCEQYEPAPISDTDGRGKLCRKCGKRLRVLYLHRHAID